MYTIHTTDDCLFVDLTTSKQNLSIRDALINLGMAKAAANDPSTMEPGFEEKINTIKQALKRQKKMTPPMKQNQPELRRCEVKLLKVERPSQIYLAQKEFFDKIEKMERDIKESKPHPIVPEVNQYVTYQGQHRALVLDAHGCTFLILLIDRAQIHDAHYSTIFELDKKFYELESAAIMCHLGDVDPLEEDNNEWSKKAIDYLKKLCTTKDTTYRATSFGSKGKSLIIDLFACTKQKAESINAKMIRDGYAIGEIYDNTDAKPDKEVAKPRSTEQNRTEIRLMYIKSPDEFYVMPKKWETKYNMMQEKIQRFALTASHDYMKLLKFETCLIRSNLPEDFERWYRGLIIEEQPNLRILLIDFGAIVSTISTNLLPMPEEFNKYRPGAIRCHLVNVKPTCGAKDWSASSVEYLRAVADRTESIAISKAGSINDNDSMPAILWGFFQKSSIGPLHQEKVDWFDINQQMFIEGFCMYEKTIHECNELCEESFDPSSASALKTWLDANYKKLDYYNQTEEEIIAQENEILNFDINLTPNFNLDQWLPPITNEKTAFVGKPTYVDNNCIIYIQDATDLALLDEMNRQINDKFEKNPSLGVATAFEISQPCIAEFSDKKFYRAIVCGYPMIKDAYKVQFIDYGNVDIVPVDRMRKVTYATNIPVLCNKYVLHGKFALKDFFLSRVGSAICFLCCKLLKILFFFS